ncbi:MAG: carbohydrate porin [Candidatus Omnitrophota bacterium]
MRYLQKVIILLLFLGILGPVKICNASDEPIRAEIAELKARIAQLEKKLVKQDRDLTELKEEGILPSIEGLTIGAGATFILQGTHNANGDNLSKKGEDVTDASYSIDLEFEKEFADYGKAFIHLEAGGGAGVEDELKVFSNVNRDADDDENVRLTEAWYEHYSSNLPLTLTFGKIDATCFIDTNEYANDEVNQFLGRIFRNSPTIEFADNAAGIRLGLEPVDLMAAEMVLMDADSDWKDMFDNIFFAGQINFKPKLFGRGGNYRILGWLNDREHTKWADATKTKEKGFGFGLSFDQELTDNLGAFVRYGWQEPDQRLNGLDDDFSLEHAWSTGLQLSGSIWGRDDDVLAFAVGQAIPSDDYKKAGSNLNAKDEGHFEAYYSFKVNEHLTLSPDIQVIWNPYGDDATNGKDTITVVGMRGQVDF